MCSGGHRGRLADRYLVAGLSRNLTPIRGVIYDLKNKDLTTIMNRNRQKKAFLPLARALGRTFASCMVLAFALTVSVFALPVMQENIYVYDEADVIPDETEADINARAKAIFALTGAKIETVCLKNTGDKTTSEYAIDLFSEWKLGTSDKNNGILILLSIEGNDYWTIQGAGLKSTLTDADLQKINNEYLEPDFAAKKYSDGVKKTFDALLGKLEAIYSVDASLWDPNAPAQAVSTPVSSNASEQNEQSSGFSIGSFFRIMLIVILIVAGVITAMTVFAFIRRPRYVGTGGSKRRHFNTERGAYVSTPSRSDLERVRTRRSSTSNTQNSAYGARGGAHRTQGGTRSPQGSRTGAPGQSPLRGVQRHGASTRDFNQYPYDSRSADGRQAQQRIRPAQSNGSQERRHEHPTVYPARPPYIDRNNVQGNRGTSSDRNGGKK